MIGCGIAVLDGGDYAVGHIVAVLDGVGDQAVADDVADHGVNAMIGCGMAVLDGGDHAVGHIVAVLDLVGGEVVLDHRVDRDVGGRGGILDGVVHAVHHVAAVHMGAEGVRDGIDGVACGNGIATPGDGGVDDGVLPVDGGEAAGLRGALTDDQVQQSVDVGVDSVVGLGEDGGAADLDVDGDGHGLVARQVVVAAADHCLVIQFCGRLCHGGSQAHH